MNVAERAGAFFLDTNIFVYSFDSTAGEKRTQARRMIEDALRTQRGVTSSQVVQEFLNVALRKFARPFGVTEARHYLDAVLMPLCRHYPSVSHYHRALLVREETGFAFYDALIVAAALELGCAWMVTEDLQAGRTVQGLTIVNPFVATP